jgi:hypothetical protein
MKRLFKAAIPLAALSAVGLIGAAPAYAHEQRQVGAYLFTVGWSSEPTYLGEPNDVQLFIHDAKGNPVDDIGTPPTIHVEVIFGNQTSAPLDLEPSYDPDTGLGTHGEFDASIIPTEPGNYTFHFYGTLNGQAIDQDFTSGPTTFNTVEDPTPIEFPTKTPTVPDLANLTSQLTPRVASAAGKANSAHSLGLIGVILGAAGLVVALGLGGGALTLARRRGTSSGGT